MIVDTAARREALNPQHSYIVQAPAGSGKTELLTQRFLMLLTQVDNPESIIALTFTKKAAGEMKARVLLALENVSLGRNNAQPETDELALRVLAQDNKHQWRLLACPYRLRIQTLDALCVDIIARMPILHQRTPYAAITEDAQSVYREAAYRTLVEGAEVPEYCAAVKMLLLHVGGDLARCVDLLASMLSWRDQWLPHLIPLQAKSNLRKILEQSLDQLEKDAAAGLEVLFSVSIQHELRQLLDFASPSWPPEKQAGMFWQKVAHLLLTQDDTWRQRVDKNLGFPAPSQTKNKDEAAVFLAMKTQITELLSELNEAHRLGLENYRRLPPTHYEDSQWAMLDALILVLPMLTAQLKLLFTEKHYTDFSEVAEQAAQALGDADNPTEVALSFDTAIQHLLIDEFQDTSLRQFGLIEALTQGWQAGDGRTLFVVGDPMQSIYRFREADVGLFLRARQSGIGNIFLRSLSLSSNFRSRPELIQWINMCFTTIFPPRDDQHLSAVTLHASTPGRPEYSLLGEITYDQAETAEQQAQAIAAQIHTIPDNESIAILVRSRAQLASILPALQRENITFQGVDIDPLATRPCIQDICFLTQALLQPANNLAWFSVLRAPWCGLLIADLLAISQQQYNNLSDDGKIRFERTQHIMQQARAKRQRVPLAQWVENTWRALGGPDCLSPQDQDNMERFFALLDNYTYEQANIPQDLWEKVNTLYANTPQESRVHIMTIHKSKGLEFDHVFLPHLESYSKKHDPRLLQHLEYQGLFFVAVLKSAAAQQDAVYDYLRYVNDKKEMFEHQRLLYVALTRAKQAIHCFSVGIEKKATSGSFLDYLQVHLLKIPPAPPFTKGGNFLEERSDAAIQKITNKITRLKTDYLTPVSETQILFSRAHPQMPLSSQNIERITGTFIHEQIQTYAEKRTWSSSSWASHLQELGIFVQDDHDAIIEKTIAALKNIQTDPRGRWILDTHKEGKNEYALQYYVEETQSFQTIILDRTFIDEDNNCRWIIDYKTTQTALPSGELSIEHAPENYRQQLENYARILQSIESRPIKLGLYYPLTMTWIAWVLQLNPVKSAS